MDFDEIKEESGKCEASYYYATVDEDGASGGGTTSSSPDVSLSYLPAPPEELFNDEEQFPSAQQFNAIVQEYLDNLSTKKRDKALVDRQRYELILQVLRDPRNTAVSTAQFRFWVKKMFELVRIDQQDIVCHDGKPVAMREKIYEILVSAHRDAHHGGRDKTASLVSRATIANLCKCLSTRCRFVKVIPGFQRSLWHALSAIVPFALLVAPAVRVRSWAMT